jgi:nucleoside-diphosphate-sugar epimerase
MSDRPTALVLGATGGIGGEMARQLLQAGWQVRALHRRAPPVPAAIGLEGVQWLRGDAMRRDDVVAAAAGAAVIVHAVNPPGYRHWGTLVLPMLDNTLAAAQMHGARIVLPGTIYNYGPQVLAAIDEASPQHPQTRKGLIRVQMEQRLRRAAEQGVRTLIGRAGDYFGPRPGNNWFSQGLLQAGRWPRAISYPGRPGVGHQWAYIPDVARTIVALLAIEERLRPFETCHMAGHWDPDGRRMVETIRAVAARPDLKVRAFPWWLVSLASPLVETFKEMREMRYLWQLPARMDNARLKALLGEEPHTPWEQAVAQAIAGQAGR